MRPVPFKSIRFLKKNTLWACMAAFYGGSAAWLASSVQAAPVHVSNGATVQYAGQPFIADTTDSNSAAVWIDTGGTLIVDGTEIDVSSQGKNSPALKISGNSSRVSSAHIVGAPGNSVMRADNASQVVEILGGNANLHLENVRLDAQSKANQMGLSVSNSGNTNVVLKNVTVDSDGTGVHYASFNGQGNLSIEDSVIRTQNGRGVNTNYKAGVISLRNFDIKTGLAANARSGLEGVFASDAQSLNLEDGRIETFSADSSAVQAFDPDAVGLTGGMKRVVAVTHGDGSDAVEIMNAASFIVEDSSVTSHGSSAHAVAAYNGGVSVWPSAHVLVKNSVIETTGRGSAGLYMSDDSTVDTEGATVKTSGASAHGAYVLSRAGFTLNNSSMTTAGENAHGINKRYTANSGAIVARNSSIAVSGEGASGIVVEALNTASTQESNTVTLEQASVSSEQAAAIRVRGGAQNLVSLSQSHVRSGTGGLALQSDLYEITANSGLPGSTRLVVDNRSTVQGDLLVNDGDLSVSLSNYSLLSGAARLGKGDRVVKTMDIDSLSGWNMTGSSTVGALNNSGFIRFSAPSSGFKTLTVQGDMVSADKSLVVLNSQLGGDDSPTDVLQIQGDQIGHSYLTVVNRGGEGALTSRGIKVIDILGQAQGSFTLTADYVRRGAPTVVGGAYAYRLYQGSSGDPADKDWYLRSNAAPPDGGGGGNDPDDGPWLQEGAPLYEVYPQMLLNLQRLPTLTQRRGPSYVRQQADGVEYGPGNGLWVRTEGLQHRLKPRSSTAQADYRMKGIRLQVGADRLLSESAQGQWLGGVSGHYTYGQANVNSRHSPGQIKTDGFGIDGTMTWYGANQSYVDLQSRLVWHKSDLKADFSGQKVKQDSRAFGYALSAEVGKTFESSPQWGWTPQAQLSYTNVRFKQFEDVYGATVRANKHASLQARLGMMLERRFASQAAAPGEGGSVYGTLDLYYEFLNGTEIELAGLRMTNRDDRLRGGVGVGGSYRWNKGKYALYGEAGVSTSLKHFSGSNMYRAMVGLNIHW